jgi:hypothetical protein
MSDMPVDVTVEPEGDGCRLTIIKHTEEGEPMTVVVSFDKEQRYTLAEAFLSPAGSGYLRRAGKVK